MVVYYEEEGKKIAIVMKLLISGLGMEFGKLEVNFKWRYGLCKFLFAVV